MIRLLAALALAGCAASPGGLRHGQSGRYHVLIGPWQAVHDACRGIGITAPGVIHGCWLRAGDAHFIWAADDAELADTLAHELRHSHEGEFH